MKDMSRQAWLECGARSTPDLLTPLSHASPIHSHAPVTHLYAKLADNQGASSWGGLLCNQYLPNAISVMDTMLSHFR